MLRVTYVVANAYEPNNLLHLDYDDAGDLCRVSATAVFHDGPLDVLAERIDGLWRCSVDGRVTSCTTVEEAWASIPGLLSTPDHSYEVARNVV